VGCQIEVTVTGLPCVKRSPTESGETERDHEGSKMSKPSPTRGVRATKNYKKLAYIRTLTVYWHIKIAYLIQLRIPIFF
jgi:hypothetical protein